MSDNELDISIFNNIESIREELAKRVGKDRKGKYVRFALAALGGVPWVGGVISGIGSLGGEKKQDQINLLQQQWLAEYKEQLYELVMMLEDVCKRFDELGEQVEERIQSDEYLSLVKKAFRLWDNAETHEKRGYIKNLITNSAATELCPDDLIRLFMDWIDKYHEAHFKVIREIYQNPGIGRGEIWDNIANERPREDSAEADLYKLLIRDLSTGGVIRQHRPTNAYGQYIKKSSGGRKSSSGVMKSAFDNSEPYELTELGSQFVHYTMNEVVRRLE